MTFYVPPGLRLAVVALCAAVLPANLDAQSRPDRCAREEVFCPLLADPKAMRSFVSYRQHASSFDSTVERVGAVGLSDAFGLAGWGWGQLRVDGAIFAQFDLATGDLLNADYLVGFPLTLRTGAVSMRWRVYHQSSHIGDELLLRNVVARENISFEAVEGILSVDAGSLRVYGGGEYTGVERLSAHGGAEWHSDRLRVVRLLMAADVRAVHAVDWRPSVSIRLGLELVRPRSWRLFVERYDGASPYGQFFRQRLRYLGIGVQVVHAGFVFPPALTGAVDA